MIHMMARRWVTAVDSSKARRSEYTASWTSVATILRDELRRMGAEQVIVEMDVAERDIRNDGWIRSDARPASPGVRITFRCRYGELCYQCGTWRNWEHNIYAVARTLRAQRMIAKDGAVQGDQVYRGFKALPSGVPEAFDVVKEMKLLLLRFAGMAVWTTLAEVHRAASRRWHPDVGGTEEAMRDINKAKDELERRGIA